MARKLKGIAAARGIAIAPVVHFHPTLEHIPTWKVPEEAIDAERSRLSNAVATVAAGLMALQQELAGAIGKSEARIYDAQMALLQDPQFRRDVEAEVRAQRVNLEVALQRVVARYEGVFAAMENPAMRERAADLRDIGRQLVGALMAQARQKYTANGADYLFAAEEFLPSDAGLLDRAHIRGIVTAHGGKYSHGAILARSLGIPAVVGVDQVMLESNTGTMAIIDGMVVRVGGQRYIVPTLNIERSFRPTPDQLTMVLGKGELARVRDALLPIYRLQRLFNLADGRQSLTEGLLLVLENGKRRACVFVDEILGQQQVVIKSLGDSHPPIRGVSGGAILGDGRVALIVDVGGLLESATGSSTSSTSTSSTASTNA